MVTCEGLGPLEERTFLGGTVADWWQAHARPNIQASPGVVWSPAAAAWVEGLEPGRRHRPDLTLLGPIAALNQAPVWLGHGPDPVSGPEVVRAVVERELPGPVLPTGPIRVANEWIFPATHWNQLLWANLLALGPFLWGSLAGEGPGALLRIAWAAARAGSVRPEDVAARLNHLEPSARIHRNATVEGCHLGAGASIGAGAVVRGSILGAGAVVEELALVEGSVLGAGARVQRLAMAKYSVLEASVYFGGIMQLGVVGRGAVVKHGATLMDMAFGQSVRVRVGGALVPAPHGLCGVCVGEATTVASGVRIAPGRAVPPRIEVYPDAAGVLSRVEVPNGCVRATVRNGGLEPT